MSLDWASCFVAENKMVAQAKEQWVVKYLLFAKAKFRSINQNKYMRENILLNVHAGLGQTKVSSGWLGKGFCRVKALRRWSHGLGSGQRVLHTALRQTDSRSTESIAHGCRLLSHQRCPRMARSSARSDRCWRPKSICVDRRSGPRCILRSPGDSGLARVLAHGAPTFPVLSGDCSEQNVRAWEEKHHSVINLNGQIKLHQ
jgi:hypothetical protein